MWSYILKRIFQFIPSLFVLSLVVFGLSRLSPGDPLQNLLEEYQSSGKVLSLSQESELIQNLKSELGLDTPDFYFSLRRRSNVLNYVRINNPNILQLAFKRHISYIHPIRYLFSQNIIYYNLCLYQYAISHDYFNLSRLFQTL